MTVKLTDKERQIRGMDTLGAALRSIVEERMSRAAHGKPWLPLYEAKEALRLGRPYRADASDPRLMLRILRFERGVFTEISPAQRAWIDELIQASNRAAHSSSIERAEADRALDTMSLLADSLELSDVVAELTTLRAHGPATEAAPDVPTVDADEEDDDEAPVDDGKAAALLEDAPRGAGVLLAQLGALEVVVYYREAINFALVHNRVSPIISATVRNNGEAPMHDVRVEMQIDSPPVLAEAPISASLAIPLGRVSASATLELPAHQLSWRLNPAPFVSLDEAASTEIRLTLSARSGERRVRAEYCADIRLLTADEWWALSIPESLAAFVRPNDPAIDVLLTEASQLLRTRTGSPSLEGYQAGAERVHNIAEAIYDAMAARAITYVEAPASFEGTGQRIRTHSEVLDGRRGTCLDLACTYAAALEQAGIFPVLAVMKGHAFTGYLTEESELPAVTITEAGSIVTIADSDLFDAVETTALCARETPISFDEARGRVRKWWRADLADVDYLLDVRAAHRRVQPMPSIKNEGGVRVVEVVRETVPAPQRRGATTTSAQHAPDSSVPHRVENWKRALLDMTYMNPLLKLKKASSTAVHVPTGGLARLEDKVADGQELKLVAHDQLAQIHQAQGARTAADVDADDLRRIMIEEDTLYVALSDREYARRLRDLQRKARASLEETGNDALYLVLGTLEWEERGRDGRAPLFLTPVRLEGGRGGTPFYLTLDDTRSLEPNYCLVEKLRTTWGLEIPELIDPGEDESGIDIERALAAIRTAILGSSVMSFRVEETAHLSLLQFSTLEMWRDLDQNWQQFMQRPVVRHLVENPGRPFIDDIDPPEQDDSAEATTFLPIPADGSQIEAVRWAAAGKSFILEGPPGTGKSQTITNLIAHCLAEGKKVLFVAEKQAALDVVKKRLESVGLGELSLDLHGKNESINAVREQITAALDMPSNPSMTWEALRSRYRSVVDSLSRYPRQLHETGPVGMSAWDARQILVELEATADASSAEEPPLLEVPRNVVTGTTELQDVYDAARDLGSALLDLAAVPDQSPWRMVGAIEPTTMDRHGIAAALDELRQSEAGIAHPAVQSVAAIAETSDEFEALASWLDSVSAGIARTTSEAAQVVTAAWRHEAMQALDAVVHFRNTQLARLGAFLPAVLDVDLDGLIRESTAVDERSFGKKKRRRAILAKLQHVMQAPAPFELKQLTDVLRDLAALRDQMRALVQRVHALPGSRVSLGWNLLDPAQAGVLQRSIQGLDVAARLRSVLGVGGVDKPGAILDRMTEEVLNTPGAAVAGEAVRRLDRAWAALVRQLQISDAQFADWRGTRTRGAVVSEAMPQWSADAAGQVFLGLNRWLRMRTALARLDDLGLATISAPVLSGALKGQDVELVVRRGVAQAVLDERFASTGLVGFDSQERGRMVENFLKTGEDVRERMVAELPGRIAKERTFDPNSRVGMVAELRQQLGKRRGGMSARRLLHRFAPVITQVTPCFLMSPGSVARFLPADAIDFDVVVFDEASQIRVPEAIGAMGRGRAVVIVGDSKQMPPSSMFVASGPSEDDEDLTDDEGLPVPVDLESILSEGVESRLPQLLLTWHYRSRDESLIAFSNSQYYEGRLSSFPTPPDEHRQPALHLRRVNGVWEGGSRGAARINRAEADAIVAEIQSRVRERPGQSIGVVTFNTQQRDHILNMLDEVRQDDSALEAALSREDEPLFVKNLENVQGDERDVILFTLAFARGANGKVPLNWGPLSRAGGERRLNVAITRAKEEVVVFCSFEPHELDLARSSSTGLADLKDYLLAARNGVEAAGLRRPEARDLHLEQIQQALQDEGLEVRARVGLSEFTVDLAVRADADKAWVAVMLDGPAWADRGSVGDREGLPTTVLTGRMGWSRVERIWLPTWLRDRAGVVQDVVDAARTAPLVDPDEPASQPAAFAASFTPTSADQPGQSSDGTPQLPVSEPQEMLPAQFVPVRAVAAAPKVDARSTYTPFVPASTAMRHDPSLLDQTSVKARATVSMEIETVIREEGPVLAERLARIVAARFGLSRVRGSRRAQILAEAPRNLSRIARNGDEIYWSRHALPDRYSDFRVPTDDDSKREISEIPYEELRNAMVHSVRGAHSMEPEDALRETARLFGITRLGANVRDRLEDVQRAAISELVLVERGGYLVAE